MEKATLCTYWNLIPVGKDNAISRKELAQRYNITDFGMRKIFMEMWNKDLPVCNLQSGYFRPKNREELREYLSFVSSYKKELEKKHYRIKKALSYFGFNYDC